MWTLGFCFECGNGVEKNEAASFKLYSKVLTLGDKDGTWILGRCFYFGQGMVGDEAHKVELYEHAIA